ncbi:hypothetical protein FACS1894141_5460 [Spirochaetia bacterium]|nr:hypothetical protein FACS1894141_5460 [Spirochaetia bacterium]
MKTATLYQNVQRLPASQQQEVSDFVSFLLNKYPLQDVSGQKSSGYLVRKPRAGCMKGTFTMMGDDFNAPLDDFKDYQ